MSEFLCRLFVKTSLFEGGEIILQGQDVHYLRNVLRATNGQALRLFNGKNGEWSGTIREISKSSCSLILFECLKQQPKTPSIILYFSPLRQNRLDVIIEKCTEIGVSEFRPILTDFTQVRKINLERLEAQIKEASEQSEQLHVAKISEPINFDSLLRTEKNLWICDERRLGKHILDMSSTDSVHLVIGPEGGFSEKEKKLMESHTKVSLGDSILRAETAAICAVSFANYLMSKSK